MEDNGNFQSSDHEAIRSALEESTMSRNATIEDTSTGMNAANSNIEVTAPSDEDPQWSSDSSSTGSEGAGLDSDEHMEEDDGSHEAAENEREDVLVQTRQEYRPFNEYIALCKDYEAELITHQELVNATAESFHNDFALIPTSSRLLAAITRMPPTTEGIQKLVEVFDALGLETVGQLLYASLKDTVAAAESIQTEGGATEVMTNMLKSSLTDGRLYIWNTDRQDPTVPDLSAEAVTMALSQISETDGRPDIPRIDPRDHMVYSQMKQRLTRRMPTDGDTAKQEAQEETQDLQMQAFSIKKALEHYFPQEARGWQAN